MKLLDNSGFLKLFYFDVSIVMVRDFSGSKSLLKIGRIKKIYAKFNRYKFRDGAKIGALYQSLEHNTNK